MTPCAIKMWGGESQNSKYLFKMQKKVIRIIYGLQAIPAIYLTRKH